MLLSSLDVDWVLLILAYMMDLFVGLGCLLSWYIVGGVWFDGLLLFLGLLVLLPIGVCLLVCFGCLWVSCVCYCSVL